jgi:hypothetical protein
MDTKVVSMCEIFILGKCCIPMRYVLSAKYTDFRDLYKKRYLIQHLHSLYFEIIFYIINASICYKIYHFKNKREEIGNKGK